MCSGTPNPARESLANSTPDIPECSYIRQCFTAQGYTHSLTEVSLPALSGNGQLLLGGGQVGMAWGEILQLLKGTLKFGITRS